MSPIGAVGSVASVLRSPDPVWTVTSALKNNPYDTAAMIGIGALTHKLSGSPGLDYLEPPSTYGANTIVNTGAPAKAGASDMWATYKGYGSPSAEKRWGYDGINNGQIQRADVPPWSDAFTISETSLKSPLPSLHASEQYAIGRPVPEIERSLDQVLNKELYLYDIARKYGINLQGVKIVYDHGLGTGTGRIGITKEAEGGHTIRIGPDALETEAKAANTIAHELSHARDYRRGAGTKRPDLHKPHGDEQSAAGDGSVYGAGKALESYIRGER
jgi:hypothetical protein